MFISNFECICWQMSLMWISTTRLIFEICKRLALNLSFYEVHSLLFQEKMSLLSLYSMRPLDYVDITLEHNIRKFKVHLHRSSSSPSSSEFKEEKYSTSSLWKENVKWSREVLPQRCPSETVWIPNWLGGECVSSRLTTLILYKFQTHRNVIYIYLNILRC